MKRIKEIFKSFNSSSDYNELKEGVEEIIDQLDAKKHSEVITKLLHTLGKDVKYLKDMDEDDKDYSDFHKRAISHIGTDLFSVI